MHASHYLFPTSILDVNTLRGTKKKRLGVIFYHSTFDIIIYKHFLPLNSDAGWLSANVFTLTSDEHYSNIWFNKWDVFLKHPFIPVSIRSLLLLSHQKRNYKSHDPFRHMTPPPAPPPSSIWLVSLLVIAMPCNPSHNTPFLALVAHKSQVPTGETLVPPLQLLSHR